MPGTDKVYGGHSFDSGRDNVQESTHMVLSIPYAMRGTDPAYGATRSRGEITCELGGQYIVSVR
eukprot:1964144-Rhodomonas_salina.2